MQLHLRNLAGRRFRREKQTLTFLQKVKRLFFATFCIFHF